MKAFKLIQFAVLCSLLPAISLAHEILHLQAEISYRPSHPDVIAIQVRDEDKQWADESVFVASSSPGIQNYKLIQVTATKNGKTSAVEVSEAIILKDSALDRASDIYLVLAKPPDKDSKYEVSWKPGTFKIIPPKGKIITNPDGPLEVEGDIAKHLQFAHPFPKNELSIKQGSDFGAWTFHYYYSNSGIRVNDNGEPDPDKNITIQEYNLHLGITSDGTFQSAQKGNYFDKFEAEIGGYLANTIYRRQPVLGNWGVVELGLSGKLQADQNFEKIDQTIGVNSWLCLHNELFDSIAFSPWFYDGKRGTKDFRQFCLPPIIKFGYDYVTNLKEGDPTSTETGHHRLDASFYWSLPVARNIEIKGIPLVDQITQVDFIADLASIYDIDESKLYPEVNLSLDFVLSKSEKVPTISLSWANGKTAPTFEHFNAFLAGFKMKL